VFTAYSPLVALVVSFGDSGKAETMSHCRTVGLVGGRRSREGMTHSLGSVALAGECRYAAFGMNVATLCHHGGDRGVLTQRSSPQMETSAYLVDRILGGLTSAALTAQSQSCGGGFVRAVRSLEQHLLLWQTADTLCFVGVSDIRNSTTDLLCTLHVELCTTGETCRAIVFVSVVSALSRAIFGSFVGRALIHGTNFSRQPAVRGRSALAVIGIVLGTLVSALPEESPLNVLIPAASCPVKK